MDRKKYEKVQNKKSKDVEYKVKNKRTDRFLHIIGSDTM